MWQWFADTLRSNPEIAIFLTLGLGFLLSVATTAIGCIALGMTKDDWSPDFSPVTTTMIGVALSCSTPIAHRAGITLPSVTPMQST